MPEGDELGGDGPDASLAGDVSEDAGVRGIPEPGAW